MDFGEGDLDRPATDETAEDVEWGGVKVRAKKCLRFEFGNRRGAGGALHRGRGLQPRAEPGDRGGQQHGAIALGISGVLQERVVYDENGQNLTGSFLDYTMPVATDIPAIELISMHTPSRRTLSGTKGMSEGGVMGAVGAVPSAVADALAPFGVVVDRQPLTGPAVREKLAVAARATPATLR